MNFYDLGLDDQMIHATKRVHFDSPTYIQSATIPLILSGLDIIAQSPTGSGKTAAFGLPLLQKIILNNPNIQTLIISPTRELAIQLQQRIYLLGKEKRAKIYAVYGGISIRKQVFHIKKHPINILIGTPGRLIDLVNRDALHLKNVNHLVIDEADELLSMGFLSDIKMIIHKLPLVHQTLLFSATISNLILKTGKKLMSNPVIVKNKHYDYSNIKQYFIKVKDNEKIRILDHLLTIQSPKSAIIFTKTKKEVDELAQTLIKMGYNAIAFHSGILQKRRINIIKKFKNKDLNILVSTNISSRGLDINDVDYIYNMNVPKNAENYVHRVGRTGRMNSRGTSITFVNRNEVKYFRLIEKFTKQRMIPMKPPTYDQVFEHKMEYFISNINKNIFNIDLSKYKFYIDNLSKKYDNEMLLAYFLHKIIQ